MTSTLTFEWSPGTRKSLNFACLRDDSEVGTVSLRVSDGYGHGDEDEPTRVHIDYISVEPDERGSDVSMAMMGEIERRWDSVIIVAGPLHDDDPPGPRFRLRSWDEAKVPIHELPCLLSNHPCECRDRIVDEIYRRLDKWHQDGGISAEQRDAKKAQLPSRTRASREPAT